MTTINIKFDKEQLEELVKKVTENVMKKVNKEIKTETKLVKMYLVAKVANIESEVKKVYFGRAYNTLSKECASELDLSNEYDRNKVAELKSQGWKEEVFYK